MNLGTRLAMPLAGIILPFLCLVGTARGDESRLQVDYDPPHLSVEAREVSLGAVLRAIGAKVGFGVVETTRSSRIVTLSIRKSSLDDVLRQLLRAKNHTMIYRLVASPSADSGAIEKIVLFADSVAATAAAIPSGGSSRARWQEQNQGDGGAKTVPPTLLTSSESWPESTAFLNPAHVYSGDPGAPPISVGQMLQAHAMAAVQSGQLAGDGANFTATPRLASSTPPVNLDAALAEATRRAQQALGTLIDGLATATRSLHQALPPGGN